MNFNFGVISTHHNFGVISTHHNFGMISTHHNFGVISTHHNFTCILFLIMYNGRRVFPEGKAAGVWR